MLGNLLDGTAFGVTTHTLVRVNWEVHHLEENPVLLGQVGPLDRILLAKVRGVNHHALPRVQCGFHESNLKFRYLVLLLWSQDALAVETEHLLANTVAIHTNILAHLHAQRPRALSACGQTPCDRQTCHSASAFPESRTLVS